MMHLVQVGTLGSIGKFSSVEQLLYQRGSQVICRTDRGLEVGQVLKSMDGDPGSPADGHLLRKVTPDDRLILERIERFRDRAFHACQNLINEHGFHAVLVDVEHLFDGQCLYFYFLGEVPDEVHELTRELAETYESKVKFRKFAQTLAEGCGPDCGTGESSCGANGCGSCSLRAACKES